MDSLKKALLLVLLSLSHTANAGGLNLLIESPKQESVVKIPTLRCRAERKAVSGTSVEDLTHLASVQKIAKLPNNGSGLEYGYQFLNAIDESDSNKLYVLNGLRLGSDFYPSNKVNANENIHNAERALNGSSGFYEINVTTGLVTELRNVSMDQTNKADEALNTLKSVNRLIKGPWDENLSLYTPYARTQDFVTVKTANGKKTYTRVGDDKYMDLANGIHSVTLSKDENLLAILGGVPAELIMVNLKKNKIEKMGLVGSNPSKLVRYMTNRPEPTYHFVDSHVLFINDQNNQPQYLAFIEEAPSNDVLNTYDLSRQDLLTIVALKGSKFTNQIVSLPLVKTSPIKGNLRYSQASGKLLYVGYYGDIYGISVEKLFNELRTGKVPMKTYHSKINAEPCL